MKKLIAVFAVLASLMFSASAGALVTVGQLAPPGVTLETCDYGQYDEAQLNLADGNSYVVPAAGVLTSWSSNVGPSPNQTLGFKVFRRVAGNVFTVVGADGPRPLTSGALNTFPISIPVLPGDVLGISLPAPDLTTQCSFVTDQPTDQVGYKSGNAGPGGTVDFDNLDPGLRLNVSATLLPPPVITSFTPGTGPIAGQAVTIAGANFAQVSSVTFGGVPAPFSVVSETQITAVAPASASLNSVPVAVTTIAGAASSATPFTYEGCAVPRLRGKRLKASKKISNRADCKIGKVTKRNGATAKTGEVTKQNPKPGAILPPDTTIKVTLAP
ncbi:MAG TPA: IPT/TIG domain-containing protein [Solirubrobacterales bacterium]|nr:IPT/TIG domain-containing protein [Solirubrobacterales bacterium]